jgi:hypothetical protein
MGKQRLTAVAMVSMVSMVSMVFFVLAPSAKAVDGCVVLVCVAGHWRAFARCLPAIGQWTGDQRLVSGRPAGALATLEPTPAVALPAQLAFGASRPWARPPWASAAGPSTMRCERLAEPVAAAGSQNCDGPAARTSSGSAGGLCPLR